MKKVILTVGALLLAIGTAVAGYLDCMKCSCNGYSSGSNNTCSNCGHSFYDHRRPGY